MQAAPHHDIVTRTELPGLTCLHRGKVRDVWEVDASTLLLVSTDRLSAFDHVLPTPIPLKGRVLTQLSSFWFERTAADFPNHVLSTRVSEYPAALRPHAAQLEGRSMLVRRARRIDVEAVVRGYLAGGGLKSYQQDGTLWGHVLPRGLQAGSRLPEPVFTPTTKADAGHDQPIRAGELAGVLGADVARRVEQVALSLFAQASEHARSRGIIIADTKFEFGWDGDRLIVIDEMLTPDSSRFWDAAAWAPGRVPENFDKQIVRDHLERIGWNKEPPVPALPPDVVAETTRRYVEAYRRLVGKELP